MERAVHPTFSIPLLQVGNSALHQWLFCKSIANTVNRLHGCALRPTTRHTNMSLCNTFAEKVNAPLNRFEVFPLLLTYHDLKCNCLPINMNHLQRLPENIQKKLLLAFNTNCGSRSQSAGQQHTATVLRVDRKCSSSSACSLARYCGKCVLSQPTEGSGNQGNVSGP
jgi:hypothetical protein